MSNQESELFKLQKAIEEELAKLEVVAEIRLSPVANKSIVEDLEGIMSDFKLKYHRVVRLWDIPVVVDSAVPADKMWILKKRDRVSL